jgi:type I restriction enzyme S subunit
MVPEGSVLVVTRSGILSHTLPVAVTKMAVTINQDLKALTPRPSVLPSYVAHALRGASRRILKQCSKHGTTVASIETNALLDFEIPLVDLDEQRRIVAELEKQFSRLDEALANLKRVKANLKRYKAAVLRAAVTGELVDLRPATADKFMTAQESGAELLARVLRARRAQWSGRGTYPEPITPDTTDLPLLPKGWVWATTDQLSDFITKGTTPAANLISEGKGEVQFLKVYNLTLDGTLNRRYKPAFVSRRTHERDLCRSKVRPGDVLINIVGPPLGQVSLVPDDLPEANINQAIARIRPVEPLSTRFMALCLMADVVIGWAIRRAKTTAGQANLTLELCRALPVPLPPLAEQQRIASQVGRLLTFADQVEAAISLSDDRAKALRMATLRSAFEPQHL